MWIGLLHLLKEIDFHIALLNQNPTQCCIQEACLKQSFKKAKIKEMDKGLPNENDIKAGIEILIPDKVEFQKQIIWDKGGYFVMLKALFTTKI